MTVEPPPRDVWVHPALSIAPSSIAGDGLVLTDDVPSGTVLIRLGGHLVSSAELARRIAAAGADVDAPYVDTITVYEDAHLVLPDRSPAHFGNHRCDPTAWHEGPYAIVARRGLHAGEEMTIDYATSSGAGGFRMMCACRSALCRRTVTCEDWRLPELQARYAGHWVPALADRIAALDQGGATHPGRAPQ